ncbi:putative disease resistance protein [Nymphaea thermarum]|nr:putative disease resistance protein [Nymphaea thermarum]
MQSWLWQQFSGFLQAFLFLYHGLAPFFHHIKDHHSHFEDLKRETDILKENRSKIEEQGRRGKPCRTVVKDWLDAADTAEKEADFIHTNYEERKRSLRRWIFNYYQRHELGKLAEKKLKEVRELNARTQFDEAAFSVPDDTVIDVPGADADEQEEAPDIIETVLGCLKDDHKTIIGIYGIKAIESADLVQQFRSRVHGFHHVLVIKVTDEPDFRKIRSSIAKELKISLSEDAGSDELARAIFYRLEQEQCLLILEDMRCWLDLNQLGVPRPTNGKGCKILLTTPTIEVCNRMETKTAQSVSGYVKQGHGSLQNAGLRASDRTNQRISSETMVLVSVVLRGSKTVMAKT